VSRWQEDRPRRHHYDFAHRTLPAIVRGSKVDLAALAQAGSLDDALAASWRAVGDQLHEADRLRGDGLRGALVELAGGPALLVTFPMAMHAAEAHFALITPLDPPDARRYITLESSWDAMGDQPRTVLGEWTAEGHLNMGDGPSATPEAFLSRVATLLGGYAL
jgi:hypothetical protein